MSERSFLAGGQRLAQQLDVTADDVILLGLPLFHTNPQVYGVMVAVQTGCSVAILPKFEPSTFLQMAARYGATGFTYVGTLLHLLLSHTPEVPEHRLRFCVGGGAPGPLWREVEQRLGVRVHELYGMTETGGWLTATGVEQRRIGKCGVVRPDMEAVILAPDDSVLPPNTVGQIAVRPLVPSVIFDGYHARPELTLQRFRNLWFHTGDLGEIDDDGFLTFHGRADDMIRRGGENVQPTAVESAISKHPAVAEVAAVGVPDPVMGQEIKVVMVAQNGQLPDVESLRVLWSEALPRHAWPRYVEFLAELPKTPTQKVKLAELRQIHSGVIDLRSTS